MGSSVIARSPVGNPTGPVYFIADAHLGMESGAARTGEGDATLWHSSSLRWRAGHLCYLVGDIFDFWFEYPYRTRHGHPSPFMAALKALSGRRHRGHFTGGNHDYWAGPTLERSPAPPSTGRPIKYTLRTTSFIAHGDGLPEGDWGTGSSKSIIRSPVAIACFSDDPPGQGASDRALGLGSERDHRRAHRQSHALHATLPRSQAGGGLSTLAVVGHVHKQMVWKSGGGTAVVVGDWMKHRSVVELTGGSIRPMSWIDGELRGESPESALEV